MRDEGGEASGVQEQGGSGGWPACGPLGICAAAGCGPALQPSPDDGVLADRGLDLLRVRHLGGLGDLDGRGRERCG